jgi:hypothetical protein
MKMMMMKMVMMKTKMMTTTMMMKIIPIKMMKKMNKHMDQIWRKKRLKVSQVKRHKKR